jgi:hypothetical protein
MGEELARHVREFATDEWPEGFVPVKGSIRQFEELDVMAHVSPTAKAVQYPAGPKEIYHARGRFWVVDERWGMADINLLKGEWRSWVLPRPTVDAVRCVEMAALWPMAQVLRGKGLYMVPAVSVARDGWGALILTPHGIEGELAALLAEGYRVVGQRWTALREEDGRVSMLRMPGCVEKTRGPRLRAEGAEEAEGEWADRQWNDLTQLYPKNKQNHAFCDAVVITSAGRRQSAHVRAIEPPDAIHALRRGWPIAELHPHRRPGTVAVKLAQTCVCAEMQLSRRSADILGLLEEVRTGMGARTMGITGGVDVALQVKRSAA